MKPEEGRDAVAEEREACAGEAAEMYKAVVDHYGDALPMHLREFLRQRLAAIRARGTKAPVCERCGGSGKERVMNGYGVVALINEPCRACGGNQT